MGDARLRCAQLKNYLDEATELIEKSDHRDHFFEIAGHLLHGIPVTLLRVDKAISAASMAVAKWEYEETKEDISPEKAQELEDALKDVRVRQITRKSTQPESFMKVEQAAEELKKVAASITDTGEVDTRALVRLIASLEGDSVRAGSTKSDVVATLHELAAGLADEGRRPSRLMLASVLRRVLAETVGVRTADGLEPDMGSQYNMNLGFEFIRDAARTAYMRGSNGHQMRQAFDQLSAIVSEIGLMCESIGASDAAGLAIRLSKSMRLARRLLRPDMLDSLVLASDEKESRFEEGKPADPTKNMSEEDAEKWKDNTDKYEDKFKSASSDMDAWKA